ncbi:MAG TPA: CPBP family intramembrane glutamic endopeptidase [Myxococcales bacterium]|nr:CPBP family intramembrane glutamic endopeptidase [Myxococcales bacterium]
MREAFVVWAAIIGALGVLELIGQSLALVHGLVGAVAVAAFLYVPLRMLERRGQEADDAGWRFDQLPRDLAWSLGASAVVLPLFGAGFVLFARWFSHLPPHTQHWIAPYARFRGFHLDLAFSWELAGQIAGNAAVAFAEEFFYRGYMTVRFEERWGPVRSALTAAALFAVGHLLTPAPWRLAVFFPALLFAWLRNRTGTIVGASIAHFLSNVWLLLLERSAF